jgi:xylulokinase
MEETGEKTKQLRVTGGLAECAYLNQIKADITGKEILEPVQKEAELLGLAIIGSCFLKKFASFAEASSAMVRIEKTYTPNPEYASLYDELFGRYKDCQIKNF